MKKKCFIFIPRNCVLRNSQKKQINTFPTALIQSERWKCTVLAHLYIKIKLKFGFHPNLIQSGRFTSPRSTLQKHYVFCTTLQFYYVFYTTFSLSPFSLILDCCTKYIENIQRCKFLMHFLQCCNKHKTKWNAARVACIFSNV